MGSRGEESEKERYGGYEKIREEWRKGELKIVVGSRNFNPIAWQNVDIGQFIKTPDYVQCL